MTSTKEFDLILAPGDVETEESRFQLRLSRWRRCIIERINGYLMETGSVENEVPWVDCTQPDKRLAMQQVLEKFKLCGYDVFCIVQDDYRFEQFYPMRVPMYPALFVLPKGQRPIRASVEQFERAQDPVNDFFHVFDQFTQREQEQREREQRDLD